MSSLRSVTALAAITVIMACGRSPEDPDTESAEVNGVTIDATHPAGVVAATIPLDSRPFGAAFSPVDRAYYVTRLDASAMGRGTLPALSFPVSVPVGSIPTNVTFNPAGTRAYVTNQFDGNVGIVNVASNTQVSTIPIAGAPFFSLVNGTATRLYVSNNSNNVAVVNLGTNAVVTTIPMPGAPNGMALNKGGNRLYVSVPGAGAVVEVNTATNGVLRTFAIGGTPQDLASTQGELFVANESGSLDVINLATGLVTGSIPLPAGGFGLAISPDLAQVYVSQPGGFLTIVDRVSKTIVTTLTLGGAPRKVSFSKAGNLAIVANEAGWVDFIN